MIKIRLSEAFENGERAWQKVANDLANRVTTLRGATRAEAEAVIAKIGSPKPEIIQEIMNVVPFEVFNELRTLDPSYNLEVMAILGRPLGKNYPQSSSGLDFMAWLLVRWFWMDETLNDPELCLKLLSAFRFAQFTDPTFKGKQIWNYKTFSDLMPVAEQYAGHLLDGSVAPSSEAGVPARRAEVGSVAWISGGYAHRAALDAGDDSDRTTIEDNRSEPVPESDWEIIAEDSHAIAICALAEDNNMVAKRLASFRPDMDPPIAGWCTAWNDPSRYFFYRETGTVVTIFIFPDGDANHYTCPPDKIQLDFQTEQDGERYDQLKSKFNSTRNMSIGQDNEGTCEQVKMMSEEFRTKVADYVRADWKNRLFFDDDPADISPLFVRWDPREWESRKTPEEDGQESELVKTLRRYGLSPEMYTINEETHEVIVTDPNYRFQIPEANASGDKTSPREF